MADYQAVSACFDEDVYTAIDLLTCLNGRKTPGGPAPEQVAEEIKTLRAKLQEVKEVGKHG